MEGSRHVGIPQGKRASCFASERLAFRSAVGVRLRRNGLRHDPIPSGSLKPQSMRSLSARLLVLTMAFVMLSEVLIYLPSIARFRLTWLDQRIDAAHLSLVALIETPNSRVSDELKDTLLSRVGAHAIALKVADKRYLVLTDDMPPGIDKTFDLTTAGIVAAIGDSLMLLIDARQMTFRVLGKSTQQPDAMIEIVLSSTPLRDALIDYSWRILTLSLIISASTAMLVFTALRWLIVRPMQRLTQSMTGFRRAPEDQSQMLAPSGRADEIGIAERELAAMQREIRAALRQRARLAALGLAVSKVNHDLRNILATAQIVSDRLAASEDPDVRRLAPRLIESLDRAIALCTSTLQYGSANESPINRSRFFLRPLFDEVGATITLPLDGKVEWIAAAREDLAIHADREQLFRILLNMGNNAANAMMANGGGKIEVTAERAGGRIEIDMRDNGPGLPPKAREHLFEPFAGTSRAGGTGLGLPIVRELLRAHGGDIELIATGPAGTHFRLRLPDAPANGDTGTRTRAR